ncbi:MAG: hypothetical protein GY857_16900 [Desulfobacula sp.]|nr:hypothetical protein [Desulfobacula sp.]
MFGLGKKKKKDKESSKNLPEKKTAAKTDPKTSDSPDNKNDSKTASKKKKKRFSKKLLFIILLVFIAVGASGFVVYTMYFTSNDPLDPDAKYEAMDLEHINLPVEMMEFTFKHFRELYISMIAFNKEINLLNSEIERINAIAKKYPDQQKIADKEKKVWEKVKNTLEKTIIKIENSIKKLYVLLSVNREQGMEQIETKKSELSEFALAALQSANEKTLKLKPKDMVPQGFIKGNIYKLKKKFL